MSLKEIFKELQSVKAEIADIKALSSEVMNAEAAAKFLGISKSSLDKISSPSNMLIATAKLGGKKKLFLRKDLLEYVEKHKQTAIAS